MPYAYGATIKHEFDTDHLNVWVTFRHPMDRDHKPPLALWLIKADSVAIDTVNSAWQDAYTLLLTSDTVAAEPARVLLEYDGPNSELQSTWGKAWQPWGPILSADIGRGLCFVDRGDAGAWDYTQATLTKDSAWHELDLSGIIPAGAKAVNLFFKFQATATGKAGQFRTHGTSGAYNLAGVQNQVANRMILGDLTVPLSTDRKIDYYFTSGTYTYIRIVVKGWWF